MDETVPGLREVRDGLRSKAEELEQRAPQPAREANTGNELEDD